LTEKAPQIISYVLCSFVLLQEKNSPYLSRKSAIQPDSQYFSQTTTAQESVLLIILRMRNLSRNMLHRPDSSHHVHKLEINI